MFYTFCIVHASIYSYCIRDIENCWHLSTLFWRHVLENTRSQAIRRRGYCISYQHRLNVLIGVWHYYAAKICAKVTAQVLCYVLFGSGKIVSNYNFFVGIEVMLLVIYLGSNKPLWLNSISETLFAVELSNIKLWMSSIYKSSRWGVTHPSP